MDGKTFRAFVSQEFCGGQASNVYSKLYSIYFTDGCAVHPVYDINILTEVLEHVFHVFRHGPVAMTPSFVSRRCLFAISQINERCHELLHYKYNGNSLLQFYSHKFYSTAIFYSNFKMHVIKNQL